MGTAGAEGRPLVPKRLGTGLECSRLLKEAYSNLEGADKRYLDKSLKEKHYVEKIHLLLHKEKNASKAKGQEEKLQAAKKASVEAELEYQTAVSEARCTTAGPVHARCRPAWPPSVMSTPCATAACRPVHRAASGRVCSPMQLAECACELQDAYASGDRA